MASTSNASSMGETCTIAANADKPNRLTTERMDSFSMECAWRGILPEIHSRLYLMLIASSRGLPGTSGTQLYESPPCEAVPFRVSLRRMRVMLSSLSRMMVTIRFNSTSNFAESGMLKNRWEPQSGLFGEADSEKRVAHPRAVARLGTASIEAGMRLPTALVDVKRLSAPSCICTDAV